MNAVAEDLEKKLHHYNNSKGLQ